MVIGITGGVGCGKSTVLSLLEQKCKARLLIADEIGHQVMRAGTEVNRAIGQKFGREVIRPDGEVDRERLASMIYAEDSRREELNAIIHPCVRKEIEKKLKEWKQEPLIVLETAILFETGCDRFCHSVWGIVADREVRIGRLMESRGYSREKSESIMDTQLLDEEWAKRCDCLIDNNGDRKKLWIQVQELLGRL